MLYIASDHAGYQLKEKIKKFLDRKKIKYEDLGTNSKESVDYPDYAKKVAKKVQKNGKGILVCGTGTGMVIAANRFKGIRASLIYDSYSAKMAKHDNNSNVACLRGKRIDPKKQLKILNVWLNEPFSKISRHKRRIKKLL